MHTQPMTHQIKRKAKKIAEEAMIRLFGVEEEQPPLTRADRRRFQAGVRKAVKRKAKAQARRQHSGR